MSASNFAPSLARVLQHEGGYVDDPADPGGATNRGVTQAVYDDWRAAEKLPSRSVKDINGYEIGAIYKKLYWDKCRCDELPSGVDYAVFDFAVNSGPTRAIRYLQRAVGVSDDGMIGPATLAAVNAKPAQTLIDAISDARLAFLEQLPTFARFGRGWSQRVNDVRATCGEMCA